MDTGVLSPRQSGRRSRPLTSTYGRGQENANLYPHFTKRLRDVVFGWTPRQLWRYQHQRQQVTLSFGFRGRNSAYNFGFQDELRRMLLSPGEVITITFACVERNRSRFGICNGGGAEKISNLVVILNYVMLLLGLQSCHSARLAEN